MKTIGLLGGMSWESTRTYYTLINRAINEKLGGFHSAKIVMVSVDFAEIEKCQSDGDWDSAAAMLAYAAKRLERAGADCIAICTNTMHVVFDHIRSQVTIPLIHIGDALGSFAVVHNHRCLGLLGTRFTMEKPFLSDRLENNFSVNIITPTETQRHEIHRIIYEELCNGEINAASRSYFLTVIGELSNQGADGVVLGCTEIGLLINQSQTLVPILDTTALHSESLVDFSLSN